MPPDENAPEPVLLKAGRIGPNRWLLIAAAGCALAALAESLTGERILVPIQSWVLGSLFTWLAAQAV